MDLFNRDNLGSGYALTAAASILAFAGVLPAADLDGSLDLDLWLEQPTTTVVPLGSRTVLDAMVGNAASSEGTAFRVEWHLLLPAGIRAVPGPSVVITNEPGGGSLVVVTTGLSLAPGDQQQIEVELELGPGVRMGDLLTIEAIAVAEDSPYGLGEAPPASPPGTPVGGLDLSAPDASSASLLDSSVDDGPAMTPWPGDLVSTTVVKPSMIDVVVTDLVADGERATGTLSNAFTSRVRVIGNASAAVDDVELVVELPVNREFLGFATVPPGASAVAVPNQPRRGQTTIEVSGLNVAPGSTRELTFLSGLVEYELNDAKNEFTTPSDGDPATQHRVLVNDGGPTPGGGDLSTVEAEIVAALFAASPVSSADLPPRRSSSVEAELLALQLEVDPGVVEIGDEVTVSAHFQVSDYAAVGGPATLDVLLPDGLVFAGETTIDSVVTAGSVFTFAGAATDVDGDTTVTWTLAPGQSIPAGASGRVVIGAVVDGSFEGAGDLELEASEVLALEALVAATVLDEGSTDRDIIGTVTADDGSALLTTPRPTLSTHLVRATLPDGTVFDAANPGFTEELPLPPGSDLVFAVVGRFPRLPVLGVVIEDFLPLYAPPDLVREVALNSGANREPVDIFGAPLEANDDNGDGFEDGSWNGVVPLAVPGLFPDLPHRAAANSVVFPLGDADPDATASLLFTTTVSSEVPEVIPDDGLLPTRNLGIGTYVDDEGRLQETFVDTQDFTVGVPRLVLSQELSSNGPVDANDQLEVIVRLDNQGSSPAYVSSLRQILPSHLEVVEGSVSIVDGDGSDIAANPAVVVEGDGSLRFGFSPSAAGQLSVVGAATEAERSVEVRCTLRVRQSVVAGTILQTSTRLDYMAVDDIGGGSYGPVELTADVAVADVGLFAEVVGDDHDRTIGETVDLLFTAVFPEGRTEAAQLSADAPPGLILMQVVETVVSPALTPTGGSPEIDQGWLRWNLGAVTNEDVDDAATEAITVTVRAAVANIVSNVAGEGLVASASLDHEHGTANAAADTVVLVEPRLTLAKTVSPGVADGSDVIQYELRLGHQVPDQATAWEVVLVDLLPQHLELVGGVEVVQGPAPAIDLEAMPELRLTWSEIGPDVTVTEPVILRYSAVVSPLVPVGAVLDEQAVVSFSSRPGSPPLLLSGVEATSERTGDTALPGGAANTYLRSAASPLTIASPVVAKSRHSGSDLQPVGGSLSYRLTLRLPEGRMDGAELYDELPPGLRFTGQTWTSVSPVLGLQVPEPTVSGQLLTWPLGDLVNLDSDDEAIETLTVEIRTVVTNEASNQAGAALVNRAGFSFNDSSVEDEADVVRVTEPQLAFDVAPDPSSGDAHDIIEYVVRVFHDGQWTSNAHEVSLVDQLAPFMGWSGVVTPVAGPAPEVDTSGLPDSVRFFWPEIHRQHTPANPVVFTYRMQVAGEVPLAADLTNQAELSYSSMPGDPELAVAGDLTTGERSGDPERPGGAVNDYRFDAEGLFQVRRPTFSKALPDGPEAAVGQQVSFELTFVVPEGRHDTGAGALATIHDTLPPGLLFLAQDDVFVSPDLSLTGSTEPEVNGQNLVWSLGNVINANSDNSSAEIVRLRYRALVLNDVANQKGVELVNSATLDFDGSSYGDAVTLTVAEPELTIRTSFDPPVAGPEETVQVHLAVYHRSGSTASAFDVSIDDLLGPDVAWAGGEVILNGPAPTVDVSALPLVRITWPEIGLEFSESSPVEMTFDVVTGPDVVLGAGGRSDSTVVSNTADLVYTSRPGDPGLAVAGNPASGERSGDPNDDGGAVNDYRDRDSAQLNNLFHVAFEDLKGSIEANDFDYNDLILEVQVDETLTEDGGRSRLEVTVEPVARGAGFRHQVNLDVAAAGPVEVARRLFSPEGQLLESDDTTLDGDWVTDVELFADSMVALPAWGGGSHPFSANTDPAQPRDEQVLGRKATVTIEMGDPGRNLPVPDDPVTLHLDEYLNSLLSLWIRVLDTNQVIRQRWVHAGATQDLVTADRYSNSPLIGFAVEQSEQFAIDWRWPVERAPVWQAYDRFSDHLLTGQTAERDWYLHPTDSQIWDSDQGTSASSIGLKSELGSVQTGRTFSDALSSVVSSSPAVADLDGDGSLEVVVGAFLNEIAVFSADGERLVSFDPAPGQALQSQASVTVADLDGDGDLELIRGYDDGRVVTLQHDGSPFAAGGFDLGGMTLKASVSVADLDGRPGPEMIICGGDGNLFVVSPTGVTLPGFPLHLGGDPDGGNNYVILPTPSVSDLDGDGSAEIVATTNDGKVWVVNGSGEARPGWPVDVAGTVLASPAVGDLDGDGVEEVVVAGDDGSVIALAADGSTLWTAQRPLGGPSSPALGDLDGDGLDDVVVGSIDGRVHGFRGDGRVLPGWPVTSESEVQSSPTTVDLDGDGVDEVVFASFDTRVYAVDGAGRPWSTPAGDPLAVSLGAIVFSSPAVADLDGNGRPEVVVGAHDRRVHVIETSGQVEGGAVIWPQFRGGGEHRGSAPAREAGPSSDEIFADGFESGATGAWSVQR